MATTVYISSLLLIYFTTEAQMVISTDYEELTCYTCKPKENDAECNRLAIDEPCPKGLEFCQAIHRIDVKTGESVYVHKVCAQPLNCTRQSVGCTKQVIDNINVLECVSCCDESYCNRWSPTNHTNAIWRSKKYSRGVSSYCDGLEHLTLILSLLAALILIAPS